jgi:hypothetical protein
MKYLALAYFWLGNQLGLLRWYVGGCRYYYFGHHSWKLRWACYLARRA